MKVILILSLVFAVATADFQCISSEFCPKGSCLFLAAPNANGTCPMELPQVHSKEEEDVNPCENVSIYKFIKMKILTFQNMAAYKLTGRAVVVQTLFGHW